MTVNRFVTQPSLHLIKPEASQTEFMELLDLGLRPPRYRRPAGLFGSDPRVLGTLPGRSATRPPATSDRRVSLGPTPMFSGTLPAGATAALLPQGTGGPWQKRDLMTASETIPGRKMARKVVLFAVPKIGVRKRTRFLTQRAGTHSGCPRVAPVFGAIFGSWKRGRVSRPSRNPIWMLNANRKRCRGEPREQHRL